ncbi:MAG: FGGY family carbohydrate kinase, partial [Planctomycetota bacterium]
MANRTHLLGIDIGTGGCKALLIDEAGNVIATSTTDYALATPKPLWSEQDPRDWWKATAASIRAVRAEAGVEAGQVGGVGLTGQMHGLVALDAAGDVLRPAILWNDQRCAAQCEAIHARLGAETVLARAGKPALASFTAPKILWVREHEPEVFSAIAKVLLPKDYVRFRLTGEFLSDVADASGTLLFDVGRRQWSHEMTDGLDIPRGWLPEVTESAAASATVSAEGARHTGLVEGTPVIAGAGD